MRKSLRYLLSIVATFALLTLPVSSLPAIASAQSAPATNCQSLANHDYAIPGGPPATIESSSTVSAQTSIQGTSLPAYCNVEGFVAPNVLFNLRMPLSTWNGNFYFGGCGGDCGNPSADICNNALSQNYAVVAMDGGHESSGITALWAYNNPQGQIEFGYTAVHVVTLAAKYFITKYYGIAPKDSLFSGCSTGGRQALMEATRYPTDFNGIIAGDPVQYLAQLNGVLHVYDEQVNYNSSGQQILTTAQLPVISKAVYTACANPADGLIDNPLKCNWNPVSLQCPPGTTSTATCLTPAQVKVLEDFYSGPKFANGQTMYPGGSALPKGGELAWPGVDMDVHGKGTSSDALFATQYLRFQAFRTSPGPNFSIWNYDPTSVANLHQLLNYGGKIYDVTNPNLSAFFAHGGKLLMYSGWADPNVPPAGVVAYYESVVKANGGLQKTQNSVRLFMFPGMYHCGGGPGPSNFNPLPALAAWVAQGVAPAQIVGTHTTNGKVTLTEAIRPYPALPKVLS